MTRETLAVVLMFSKLAVPVSWLMLDEYDVGQRAIEPLSIACLLCTPNTAAQGLSAGTKHVSMAMGRVWVRCCTSQQKADLNGAFHRQESQQSRGLTRSCRADANNLDSSRGLALLTNTHVGPAEG